MLQELSNDIKNATRHWGLTPSIALWSFILHLPKWELPWECEGSLSHTPSHFLTLPGVCDVIPGLPFALTPGLPLGLTPGLPFGLTLGLPFSPHPCNSICLGCEPKARVATWALQVEAYFESQAINTDVDRFKLVQSLLKDHTLE